MFLIRCVIFVESIIDGAVVIMFIFINVSNVCFDDGVCLWQMIIYGVFVKSKFITH